MKIVKIIGGLGNQMFQYAFFLTLQNKGLNPTVDISEFETYSIHHGLELENVFNIDLNQFIPLNEELDNLKDKNKYFKYRKLLGNLIFSNPNKFLKSTHFVQPKYSHFYGNLDNTKDEYLDGYWQNENYFKEEENLIRQLFQWKKIDKKNTNLAKIIRQENSVSIHIRRLDNPINLKQVLYAMRLRLVWRVASKKYYLKAIEYINNRIDKPHYYILTDNINWVKKNIPLNSNFTIIDWNRGQNSNQDMYLMTQCSHNIISMSSFSWWGAWLNNNSGKIIIAPKKWALRFSKNDEIIPNKWIRI